MAERHMPREIPAAPLDPYLDWAIQNDFRHQRPGEWLPLLVRFDAQAIGADERGTALERFVKLGWIEEDLKKSVRAAELLVRPPEAIRRLKDFDFCFLYVAKKDAQRVTMSASWLRTIIAMDFSPPFDPAVPAAPKPADPAPPQSAQRESCIGRFFGWLLGRMKRARQRQTGSLTFSATPASQAGGAAQLPRAVAVAVIDEGIAFAHECFQGALGPRVGYLWKQTGIVGNPVGPFGPGTELTAAQIATEMGKHPAGPAGEDATYRAIGDLDYGVDGYKALARRRSHGSHVMSIAAKMSAGIGANQRPIIGVELPEFAVGDPVGSNLYAYIFLGVVYALDRVQFNLSSGNRMPLVCNVSYGPHTGPHDGHHILEDAIEAIIQSSWWTSWPLEVVLAGGNFRQSRVHAALAVTPRHARTLQWRVQPEDRLPNFVELWVPRADIAAVTVTVTPPLGVSLAVTAAMLQNQQPGPNGPVFWMWLKPWNGLSTRQAFVIAVQPTATDPPLDSAQPTAPSGVWTITVSSTVRTKIETWIRRKANPGGRRLRGRQSYFDDPRYVRFQQNSRPQELDPGFTSSYVLRRGTLSGIATCPSTRVIGAYRRWPGLPDGPPSYASMGPPSGGPRVQPDPDMVAAGDDSTCMPGVLAAGTRSGYSVAMNGTSVSAPQFAHWLAEAMAWGPALPIPYDPKLYQPPLVAGAPQAASLVGGGYFVYPQPWYRVWRQDRPTLC